MFSKHVILSTLLYGCKTWMTCLEGKLPGKFPFPLPMTYSWHGQTKLAQSRLLEHASSPLSMSSLTTGSLTLSEWRAYTKRHHVKWAGHKMSGRAALHYISRTFTRGTWNSQASTLIVVHSWQMIIVASPMLLSIEEWVTAKLFVWDQKTMQEAISDLHSTFVCHTCRRDCYTKIGLLSHSRCCSQKGWISTKQGDTF